MKYIMFVIIASTISFFGMHYIGQGISEAKRVYRAPITHPNKYIMAKDFDALADRVERLELEISMLKKRRAN